MLAGLSAGAMCWFEGGISVSGGRPAPARGLGLLRGSLSVHLRSERQRLPAYRRAIAGGALPDGYALDDSVALLFVGRALAECFSSQPSARALRVGRTNGGTEVSPLPLRLLPGTPSRSGGIEPVLRPAVAAEELALRELRQLRRRFAGWPSS